MKTQSDTPHIPVWFPDIYFRSLAFIPWRFNARTFLSNDIPRQESG